MAALLPAATATTVTPGTDNVGLFNTLETSAIRNLAISGANVTGGNKVGVLAGVSNSKNAYTDITVTNSQVTGQQRLGLLAGLGNSGIWTSLTVDGTDTSIVAPSAIAKEMVDRRLGDADHLGHLVDPQGGLAVAFDDLDGRLEEAITATCGHRHGATGGRAV